MDDKRRDREGLAAQLNRMLESLRSFGIGAGQAPTINQAGVSAVPYVAPPLEQQQGMPQPMQAPQGQPDVSALMGGPHQGTPMQGMHRGTPMQGMGRDNEAMDRMMMAIAQPYMEGPNMNIGDDTRERAMAWLRAQQGG